MYTRASSIRSNYTTTSAKTKFIIPQRIVGGSDSLQHYNALHISDTPVMKNNNVMNGKHNWTVKSSWPFNQTTMMANGTVVEWQDKKCVCFSKIYCKGTEHSSCTTTMATATSIPLSSMQNNNKNARLEPISNHVNTASIYSHDVAKNCCHCHDRKTICKENYFDSGSSERCCMPKTAVEWEQIKLCAPECSIATFTNTASRDENGDTKTTDGCDNMDNNEDGDDDNDGDDTDFRNEIIRINNIYNNCNANTANINADMTMGDSFHLHGFNNSCISLRKYKNDINL